MVSGYRFSYPIDIRYGDMDTLGHVNNAKYLTYLEQARVHYFRELALWDGSVSDTGFIVARIEIDYKLPLSLDDRQAVVYTRTGRMGSKSLDLDCLIVRAGDEAVAAASRTVMVAYDYVRNQSVPLLNAWRQRISEYDGA
jgi:acyl-CoA thioester hydrolase